MRLIDADALQRKICGAKCGCEYEDCGNEGDCEFDHFIFHAPTVDAVVVTRCKDCEHLVNATVNGNGFLICDISDMETAPDDFCSHGDRREEAGP